MRTPDPNKAAGPAPARIVAALAGLVLPGALLAGCAAEEGPPVDASGEFADEFQIPAEAGSAAAEADRDCLVVVWEQQDEPDRNFDRANDMAQGGLISCATGTSASQYEATLSALRAAASGEDREAMLGELRAPLLYIDAEGNRRELVQADIAAKEFAEVFSPEMLAVMRGLDLSEMTVVPDQGGFFELGAIWLTAGEPGGRPQVVTLNRQALEEAVAASAERAETSS